jgi:hypothetical protein
MTTPNARHLILYLMILRFLWHIDAVNVGHSKWRSFLALYFDIAAQGIARHLECMAVSIEAYFTRPAPVSRFDGSRTTAKGTRRLAAELKPAANRVRFKVCLRALSLRGGLHKGHSCYREKPVRSVMVGKGTLPQAASKTRKRAKKPGKVEGDSVPQMGTDNALK